MVQEAIVSGVPFRWVGGDSVYGDSPTFVQGIRALQKWYVVDTSSDARVWLKRPRRKRTGRSGPHGGRPRQHPQAVTKPISVAEAIRRIPASAWKRITVSEGSQGPLVYDYAEMSVFFSEEGLQRCCFVPAAA